MHQEQKNFPKKKKSYKSKEQFGRNAESQASYKWQPNLDYDIQDDKSMGRYDANSIRRIRRPKD